MKLEKGILLLIILVSILLRVFLITRVPAGFFSDEASIGYNAYTILTTGRDEYGEFFPIFFRSFGDFRHPFAVYATVPFIYLFGLSELAVRLHAVFFGIILVVTSYFLGKSIKGAQFGLWLAGTTATMPWLIYYSRVGFEFSTYASLFTICLFFALKTLDKKQYILPFFIFSAVTIYTYQPAKLLVPLFVIGTVLILKKSFLSHKKEFFIGSGILGVFSLPLLVSFYTGEAIARFTYVSLFNNTPVSTALLKATSHYFYQLSPQYLFFSGDPTFINRHFTQGLTPLLLVTFPFLIVGIVKTIQSWQMKSSQLLLFVLFLYPIAGALVHEAPFTSRAIIGAPVLAVFITVGIYFFLNMFHHVSVKKVLSLSLSFLLGINTLLFFLYYIVQYPKKSSDFWGWQYGAKEIMSYFKEHEAAYDELIMEPAFNASEIFLKFYTPNSCAACMLGYFDKQYDEQKRQLFAVTPKTLSTIAPVSLRVKKIIYYPDMSPAFYLLEKSAK